jgi:hypothetical protein
MEFVDDVKISLVKAMWVFVIHNNIERLRHFGSKFVACFDPFRVMIADGVSDVPSSLTVHQCKTAEE